MNLRGNARTFYILTVNLWSFCGFSVNSWAVDRYFTGFTTFKGTNGRQKTYEIFHVYCIFYSGFMCQTTVIFGITKDGSHVLNILAS